MATDDITLLGTIVDFTADLSWSGSQVTRQVTFAVKIVFNEAFLCQLSEARKGFTAVTYRQGSPAKTVTLDELAQSHCDYSVSLLNGDNEADSEVFALTQPTFAINTSGTFSVSNAAQLTVETSDQTKIGYYSLSLQVTDNYKLDSV